MDDGNNPNPQEQAPTTVAPPNPTDQTAAAPTAPAPSPPQPPAPGGTPPSKFSIDDLPWWTVPAALLGVPAFVAILAAIWPQVFFDGFVEKYYWGPIRTDSGYNPVNTISWAVLLGLCLLGLTQMVNALKLKMNNTMIYGAVAWVVTGAIFRVLEDTRMFEPPLQYIMITPPIYLLFAVFAIINLLIGVYIQKVEAARDTTAAMQKLWFIQAALVLVYTLLWAIEWDQVGIYVNPITVAVLVALNHFIIRFQVQRHGSVDPAQVMLLSSIAPFLLGMAYVVKFINDPWSFSGTGIPSSFVTAPLLAIALTGVVWSAFRAVREEGRNPMLRTAGIGAAFAVILGIVVWTAPEDTRTAFNFASVGSIVIVGALVALLGIGATRLMQKSEVKGEVLAAFQNPLNLVLIASQLMDGFATSLGLDLAGYHEKHVLSAYIINAFESFAIAISWSFGAAYPTFLAFVPVKLLVSIAVVYAIDVYSKEDVEKYPTLIGLVKFAIIMVGIGPAVRDFVRLSLGV